MPAEIRPYTQEDRALLARVLADPGVTAQYDVYAGPDGVERMLSDPYTPAESVRLAFADGEVAGFACVVLLPAERPWAMLRGAVLPAFRRRGLGRALHDAVRAYLVTQTRVPDLADVAIAASEPLEVPEAMFARLGYEPERTFWYMRRERGGTPPEPRWPAGVTVRALDGGDAMLADWNDAYNDSFAEHYRFVPSPLSHARELAARPGFRPDGVQLAYRDGRVAGFCSCQQFEARGEIAALGTMRHARGLGLGRALLRWGVGWLEREGPHPVTLLVDGDNESALELYRSEGFVISRTRRIWTQPGPAA